MDTNPISEEQMWEWVDEGTAHHHLDRLKHDPNAEEEDICLLEEVIQLHEKLNDLPIFKKKRRRFKAHSKNLNAQHSDMETFFKPFSWCGTILQKIYTKSILRA